MCKTGRSGAQPTIKVSIASAGVCMAWFDGFDPAATCGAAAYDLEAGSSSTVKKGDVTVAIIDVDPDQEELGESAERSAG